MELAYPHGYPRPVVSSLDLTGDNTPEIAVSLSELYIFGCRSAQYVPLLKEPLPDIANSCDAPVIEHVLDMNMNGRPEVLVHTYFLPYDLWQVLEWQGDTFRNILSAPGPDEYFQGRAFVHVDTSAGHVELSDTDGDGITELLIYGGFSDNPALIAPDDPWPIAIQTYAWDGSVFSQKSVEYLGN